MDRYLVGEFDNEFDLKDAVKAIREHGFIIEDAYTPYGVHGLDKAMGLKPSRLAKVCFGFASLGLSMALWLQYKLSAVDWPINIGGRPWNSVPAFMPIAFEVTILFAGLGTVFSFFLWRKIKIAKRNYHPTFIATNNKFFVVILKGKQRKPMSNVMGIIHKYHGRKVEA
jgi:hypothetical protein